MDYSDIDEEMDKYKKKLSKPPQPVRADPSEHQSSIAATEQDKSMS